MKFKLFLRLLITTVVFCFAYPIASYAQTTCQPIYGGGETCVTTGNFILDKKILNTKINTYVDNLGANDMKFEPGQVLNFQIDITNKGTTSLQTIDVKDIFPQYLNFETGPGSFDEKTKSLTFNASNLAANEKRTFKLSGRIVDSNQISVSNGFVCVVNQVIAVNPADTSQKSQDNSQFCIGKNGVTSGTQEQSKGGFPVISPAPVYTTPATGVESLALISLLPTGIAGWFLRKISQERI